MYLGPFRLGEEVSLVCQTVNGTGAVFAPTDPPTVRVMAGTTLVETFSMPLAVDPQTGLFAYKLFLDSAYSTGVHEVSYKWVISGTTFQQLDRFEIVAGGNSKGAVTSVYPYFRPDANLLVRSTSSGELLAGRNPR